MSWVNGRWTGEKPTIEDLHHGSDGPPRCSCCRYPGVEVKVFAMGRDSTAWTLARDIGQSPYRLLCGICASTMASAFLDHKAQHDRDTLEAMRMLAYVGNAILHKLDQVTSSKQP